MRKPNPAFAREPGRSSNNWSSTGLAPSRPLAVTIAEAAELLDLPVRTVRRYVRHIEPYRHADGSPRWSLKELARFHADTGRVVTR